MCFIDGGFSATGPRRLNAAAKYTLYRRRVEYVPANDVAIEFHDGDVQEVPFVPVGPRVDVPDHEFQPAVDERQQRVDQHVAQVAALAAVDVNDGH